MSTGTTLYYPFIHPRSSNHLKAAMLYWDRVRRIVPASMWYTTGVDGDDDDAKILADKGVLVSTRPEPYEDAAASKFFASVEPQADLFRIDVETAKGLAARNRGLHVEKFGHKVLGRLHSLGLAHRFGDWVAMHDEVGAFYMFCLASEMADKMASPLLTDSQEEAELGQAFLFAPQLGDPVSDMLLKLGIRLPSAEQLEGVPMDRMAAFAEQRGAERQRFRLAVEGIVEAAQGFTDQNAMNDYLSSQRVIIKTAVDDLLKTIDELGVGSISNVAKITVPGWLGRRSCGTSFFAGGGSHTFRPGSGDFWYLLLRGNKGQAATGAHSFPVPLFAVDHR